MSFNRFLLNMLNSPSAAMSSSKTYKQTPRSKWTKEQQNEALDDKQNEVEQWKARAAELQEREDAVKHKEQFLAEKATVLNELQDEVEGVLMEADEKGVKIAKAAQRQALIELAKLDKTRPAPKYYLGDYIISLDLKADEGR